MSDERPRMGDEPSAAARLTGSAGVTPVQDSLTRALWTEAVVGPAQWLLTRFVSGFSMEDWAILQPAILVVAFVSWGLWDKFVRSRLP